MESIRKNYEFLELMRTKILRNTVGQDSSALEVLIFPPTEGEMKGAEAFAKQYYTGLSEPGLRKLSAEAQHLASEFALDGAGKWVVMSNSPPDTKGVVTTSLRIAAIENPPEFLEEYKKGGALHFGKFSFSSGGEPPPNWRFAHIFNVVDQPASEPEASLQ